MSHATWDMGLWTCPSYFLNPDVLPVQKKFDDAWKYGTKPTIKKIYKIIEGKTFLLPYDKYKLVPLPFYYNPNLTTSLQEKGW